MTSLLNTEYHRLWKTLSFWVIVIIMPLIDLLLLKEFSPGWVNLYGNILFNELLFYNSSLIGIASAISVSLFTGEEFSSGSIRNKIAVGRSRLHIYFTQVYCGLLFNGYNADRLLRGLAGIRYGICR